MMRHPSRTVRIRTLIALATTGLAAPVLLSACGTTGASSAPSSGVQRAAEAASAEPSVTATPAQSSVASAEASASATPEPSNSGAPLRASVLGTRVCVINDRSEGQRPVARLNVLFTKADRVSLGSELVSPKDQRCAEAAYSSAKYDVSGEIGVMYIQAQDMTFHAYNSPTLSPAVSIQKKGSTANCAASFAVGEKDSFDDGVVRYTTERLPDSNQYKEFTITVSDSQGATGACKAKPVPTRL